MRPSLYQCTAIALCAGLFCGDIAQAQFVTRGGARPQAQGPLIGNAAAAVPAPPTAISQAALTVVNDEAITRYDLTQRMRLIIFTQRIPQDQIEGILPLLQAQALNQLIDEKVQMQSLKKESIERKAKDIIMTDKEIDNQVSETAQDNRVSVAELMNVLAQNGIDASTYREQIRISSSWDAWIHGLYRNQLTVSEGQIAAYQRQMAEQSSKTQYHLAEIELDPKSVTGGADVAVTAATGLVEQINSGAGGATFAAAARQFSVAASAIQDGDMGIVTLDALPPAVAAVVPNLKVNEISAPIVTPNAIYLIQMIEKRDPSTAIMATLSQAFVALPANAPAADVSAAEARLNQIRGEAGVGGCTALEASAAKVRGVTTNDLGETQVSDLAPSFRDAVTAMNVGQISAPLRSQVGLHLLAVCGKRNGGEEQLSHDDISNKLSGDKLEQIKRTQTRNLRAKAIVTSIGDS